MKMPLRNWAQRDKFTLFFCSAAFLLVAIVLFSLRLTIPKITNAADLKFISGKLSEHHFDISSRGHKSCWFMLTGYTSAFYISEDNLKHFDVNGFENLSDGETVSVGISKRNFNGLSTGQGSIFIFYFSCNGITLDAADSIKNYNSNFMYYICSALFFAGLVFLYLGSISKNKTRPGN